MAWRGFGFGVTHVGRTIGEDAITYDSGETTDGALHNFGNFSNGKLGRPFRFEQTVPSSASVLAVDFDQGAQFAETVGTNALVIPAGHTLDASITCTVTESSDAAFPADSRTRDLGSGTATAGEAFAISVTASAWRYLRVKFSESAFPLGEYTIPDVILTEILRPAPAEVSPGWDDSATTGTVVSPLVSGGRARVTHAPPLRTWALEYEFISAATDIAALDSVAATSDQFPIVLEPPYTTDPPALASITKRDRSIFFPQVSGETTAAAGYAFTFREWLG